MYLPPSSSQSSPLIPTPDTPQCGFVGNNDIYGIGIRIGIYAQILAVWFANYFLFSEAQILRDAVSVFSVAILVVSLIFAADPSDVYAVEGFILLQILAWSCMMGVRAKSSYSKGTFSRGSLLRRVVCDVMNLMSVCLQVWFWWSGLDRMKKTPCGTWLMMYVVKTSMFGWARKVMMAMSLFMLVCTVYWTATEFSRPWMFWRMRRTMADFEEAVAKWELRIVKEVAHRESEADAVTVSDALSEQTFTHDGCSNYSCDQCSPIGPNSGQECGDVQGLSTVDTLVQQANPTKAESSASTAEPDVVSLPATVLRCLQYDLDSTILQQVHEAEIYIQHCIASTPYPHSSAGAPLPLTTIIRSILFPKRYRSTPTSKSTPPSWLQCQIQICTSIITLRASPQALAIYSHLRQTRLLDPFNGPFQIHAALTYSDKLPPWPCVLLASSILSTAPSTPKKLWLGWYYALLDVVVHVIVILQLELTLHWNNVSGLSGLWTSLGQLLPFIIGVGGLGLVIGRWVVRIWEKRRKGGLRTREDDANVRDGQEDGETFGLGKGVMEAYGKWKDEHGKVDEWRILER
jgi:hypothetical protein